MNEIRYTSEDFDRFVHVLISRWEDAVELESEWMSLHGEQRAVLTEDWPINNIIQRRLEEYARTHDLTEDQRAQYARLRAIIAEHSGTLEAMGYRVLPIEDDEGRAVA